MSVSRIHFGKNPDVFLTPHMSKKLAVSFFMLYFSDKKKRDIPKRVGNVNMRILKRHYISDRVPLLTHPVVVPLGTVSPAAPEVGFVNLPK